MTVGVLRFRLRLPSRSLKEKRSIVKSVVERLRTRYNASVAEVEELDSVEFATLAVVVVSNEGAHAGTQLRTILDAVRESRLDAELLDVETELIAL